MDGAWHVISNPNSGSALPRDQLSTLCAALGRCEFHETAQRGDASTAARQVVDRGGKRILVAGGDGTLNEVLNGIAPGFDDVELALLPQGTGNDLARYLEIPRDPEQALAKLLQLSQPRQFDVVLLKWSGGQRYFLNASAGGFSTIVNEKLDRRSKSMLGALAFLISAAKALPELQRYRVQALVDQDEQLELDAYAVMVFNGRYVGAGFAGVPWSKIDDGKLELLIVPVAPVLELAPALRALLFESEVRGDVLLHRQTSYCRISATPAFELNADGEVFADTPAEYILLPRRLTFWA